MSNVNSTPDKTPSQHATVCPYCQRRFETSNDLTLHIVTRHTQIGVRRGPAQASSGK